MKETDFYYEQLRKYVIEENFIMQENSVVHDEGVPVELFTNAEVQKSLSSCSNGKSPGIGGVRYEDIKNNWEEYGEDIVRLFNIILINKKFSISRKHAIIQWNYKKNFNRNDLSTLRDISLLPTLYKVFSCCLCNRLIEFISNEIFFWQRAYLEKYYPLSFKVCTLNNMALAKVFHFFCNTHFQDKLLVEIDMFLTNKVRELFSLYKSTTRDVIYLSHLHGVISIKQFSTVYYCARFAFITKMLNHNEEIFKNIAPESLKLDMTKRGINTSNAVNNFLGYEVNNESLFSIQNQFWLQNRVDGIK